MPDRDELTRGSAPHYPWDGFTMVELDALLIALERYRLWFENRVANSDEAADRWRAARELEDDLAAALKGGRRG